MGNFFEENGELLRFGPSPEEQFEILKAKASILQNAKIVTNNGVISVEASIKWNDENVADEFMKLVKEKYSAECKKEKANEGNLLSFLEDKLYKFTMKSENFKKLCYADPRELNGVDSKIQCWK